MARLVRRTAVGKKKVYDVTIEGTHSFFAYSRHGSGTHAVLAHNCHELSRQAMDAMLKPLEDNLRGTQDKQLICIFCTTEPEKMRSAILSRCAPLFRIRNNTPQEIGTRLAFICDQEGIEYDPEVLPLIAEVCESHVRDSIKAVEGVSMLGKVDRENVTAYLHMDANALYLDLIEKIGFDLEAVIKTVDELDKKVSPATCYERMADVCMLAYRLTNFGAAKVPSYWDRDRLKAAGDLHREFLVEFARRFSERPAHSSSAMFVCDVSALHQKRAGIAVVAARKEVAVPSAAPVEAVAANPAPAAPTPAPAAPAPGATRSDAPPPAVEPPQPIEPSPRPAQENAPPAGNDAASLGNVSADPIVTNMGVHVNPIAQNTHRGVQVSPPTGELLSLGVGEFAKILQRRVIELTEEHSSSGRPARPNNVGGS